MASPRLAQNHAEAMPDIEAQQPPSTTIASTRFADEPLSGDSSNDVQSDSSYTVNSDLSDQKPELASVGDKKIVSKRSSGTGRNLCRLSCCSFAFVLSTLLVVFLQPREPTWEVQKLIVPPAALNNCIQAIMSPSGENVKIDIDALVDFVNPNYVGAEADAGSFVVTWQGYELASVTTERGLAAARSHSQVTAHSTSIITPELGNLLKETLPGKNYLMQVNVKGKLDATVKSLFGLRVKVGLDCIVDASVLLIMSDPDKLVIGHKCTYDVSL
eukprot:CAMPEP_0115211020 /NCGR_PEP_ID=MMETSP0270-20121206/22547_1 /TAXON_ID=71861 /ORGANISM="Scrippsiella trochoidea, Strain CCMP3099" /LENGTH=271 /DNA_ID=CAMNT_0002624693 /DNA_START=66 /DNA_END=881 /DNA_ORIENTATION=+